MNVVCSFHLPKTMFGPLSTRPSQIGRYFLHPLSFYFNQGMHHLEVYCLNNNDSRHTLFASFHPLLACYQKHRIDPHPGWRKKNLAKQNQKFIFLVIGSSGCFYFLVHVETDVVATHATNPSTDGWKVSMCNGVVFLYFQHTASIKRGVHFRPNIPAHNETWTNIHLADFLFITA